MVPPTKGLTALVLLTCLGSTAAILRAPAIDGIYIGQEDACTCMNWKETYDSGLVNCGRSLEFFLVTKRGVSGVKAAHMIGDEFCGKFFSRIKTNFCVNTDFNHKPRGFPGMAAKQWCYVSSDCENLHGGWALPGLSVSVKACNSSDSMLRNMSPEQLDAIRGNQDLDLGLLAKFSYPIWQDERWPQLENLFIGDQAASNRRAAGRSDLDEVVASGEPMLFDSKDGHPPFHVVVGSKIYKINFKPDGRRNYARGRMGDVNEMFCIQGCQ
uniref:Uncharacterized protein n=1 Tax=Alexandrium monilatum TaxID=311494 RepID=A0A6T1N416_9DINO|mmetsp:Transcript_32950/g.98089  ORF Transcript_32950/g.98089 Transcript_32950/m.98089 type:complete len:269 (+) Transcript_32950:48-854(+)